MFSLELCRDVPLTVSCPADHLLPDWQPRILLGMVDARSVNVKNTQTNTRARARGYVQLINTHISERP